MSIIESLKTLNEKNINLELRDGELDIIVNDDNMTDEMLALITNNKDEFKKYLENEAKIRIPSNFTFKGLKLKEYKKLLKDNNIDNSNVSDIYNLTPMQEGFLFHSMMDKESSAYFEQISLDIKGDLDISYIREAWNQVVRRHDLLRTMFISDFRVPLQVVLRERELDFLYLDVREKKNNGKNLAEIKRSDRGNTFNLKTDPLFRINLIQREDDKYTLIISFHHIILDGWCLPIIISEFLDNYLKLKNGEDISLELPPKYSEYISWLNNRETETDKEYWKSYLEDYKELAIIPNDNMIDYQGDEQQFDYSFSIDKELTSLLKSLALEIGVTLNTIIQTVWGIILSRYNGTDDVVFGSAVSGRHQELKRIEEMVGLFINTIPVRIKLDENERFKDVARNVQQNALEGIEYHYSSLVEIQNCSSIKKGLFDHIIVFENYPISEAVKGKCSSLFEVEQINSFERINYDFGLTVSLLDHVDFKIHYNPLKFSKGNLTSIASHVTKVLEEVVTKKDLSIKNLEIISEEEKNNFLNGYNSTKIDYSTNKTIIDLFEEQAEKTPDNIAVVFENTELTYRDLNMKANKVGHYLRDNYDIKPDGLVGILLSRSENMIIALLGILKSGAAYIPLDPDYPQDRIDFMLEDSSPSIVINEKSDINNIDINEILKLSNKNENLKKNNDPNNMAYVIYTSGSTGNPKGVMIENKAVVNLVNGLNDNIFRKYNGSLNLSLFASFSFDASVQQIFSSLLLGHSLHIVPLEYKTNVEKLLNFYIKNAIDIADGTPILLDLIGESLENYSKDLQIKEFIIGGDALKESSIKGFISKYGSSNVPQITNVYGPTECCVDSSFYIYSNTDSFISNIVPIGKPLPNIKIFILDKNLQLLPNGVVGELCISGDCIGRGYLNNVELTSEKFVTNPFACDERMYRTGDLAKWLPDGNLDFLGRIDNQVKIRGFRIELGEIEKRLLDIDEIKEAVVITKERENKKIEETFNNENEVIEAMKKYRNTGSKYDVLIPVSGGVDSCFTLIKLVKEYKLKPLAFHNDHGWENPIATDNVIKVCNKLGVDYIIADKEKPFFSKLLKYFNESGQVDLSTCSVCGNIIYLKGLEVAAELNIPLVINGYSKGQVEMIQDLKKQRKILTMMMDVLQKVDDLDFLEKFMNKMRLLDKHIIYRSRNDLEKDVDLSKILFVPFFVFNFYKTDKKELRKICMEYFDWKVMPTSWPNRTTNCDMIWLNSYVEMEKRGYTLYHQEYSVLIRSGEITREQAIEDLKLNPSKGLIKQLSNEIDFDSQKILKKESDNLQICKSCLLPETYPDISFDDKGVCNYCNTALEKSNKGISNAASDRYMCSYIKNDGIISNKEIRSNLAKFLPDYMIPSYFIQMDAFPLTPNGKIDRKALPEPEGSTNSGVKYIAPVNDIQKTLVEIWEEVLGIERIGILDDFFELGGHSLKATRVVSRISKDLEVNISLNVFFEKPTIESLSQVIVNANKTEYQQIEVVSEQDSYELSNAQRRLWILDQFKEDSIAYNMPASFIFEGKLNIDSFRKAFSFIIERHESLRTVFTTENGEARQKILKHSENKIEIIDLRNSIDPEKEALILAEKDILTSFDLETEQLVRFTIVKIEDEKLLLLFNMHHIISDGWSMNIFIREFLTCYHCFCKGNTPELPLLRIHYKDYSAWQNKLLEDSKMNNQREYWLDKLSGELPVLDISSDNVRPVIQTFNGYRMSFHLSKEINSALADLCRNSNVSLFMMLQAVVKVLFNRYTGQSDIIIGSPVAGRIHEDLEDQIGFYVNTLALRDTIEGELSFTEILNRIGRTCTEAFDNQTYPFDKLVEDLGIKGDLSRSPLFDVMLMLENNDESDLKFDGLNISPYKTESNICKFDMTFSFSETEEGLYCDIDYNTDIYADNRITRMAEHFKTLVSSILGNPESCIKDLEIIRDEEKNLLLNVFNDTKADYPVDKTIIDLFEEQVKITPDNIAVVFEDTEITYRDLNVKSNIVGHYLKDNYDIKPDDLVGVLLERSEMMIIAILGILKSGAAYVPIDPEYPQDRINFILDDSNPKLVLSQRFTDSLNRREIIDIYEILKSNKSIDNLSMSITPGNLAYVIYTSGSTGKPKGILLEHKSLVNLSQWHISNFELSDKDNISQYASISFDASVWEIFPSLIAGSKVHILEDKHRFDLDQLSLYLKKNSISVAFLPTPVYEKFNNKEVSDLRILLTGGEKLESFNSNNYKLYNNYGPTENAVVTTSFLVNSNTSNIPIGKPISNTQIFILDKYNNLLPQGYSGEICISGFGLARGYLNRAELTSEMFIENPFMSGERMYRTGDMARWLPDGSIEFLGRIDNQVKIRGFRIELGEIENCLLQHDDINSVVVHVKDGIDGDKQIAAYIVSDRELEVSELRVLLKKSLPEYMIPTYLMQIDELPLTHNGKIDRKALPELDASINSGVEYVAPVNKIQNTLVNILQDILGIERIGILDNFFDLGGHSLKATGVVSRVGKELEVNISLLNIFENPTVKTLSELINTKIIISDLKSTNGNIDNGIGSIGRGRV